MNNWRSLPSQGGLIGIGFTILSGALCAVVTILTLTNALAPDSAGDNLGTFFLGLAAAGLLLSTLFLAWRTWCFFRLRYYLDRNALTIDLGDSRQFIPLANIRQVTTAESLLILLKQEMRQSQTDGPATTPGKSALFSNETVISEIKPSGSGSHPFGPSSSRRAASSSLETEEHTPPVTHAADSSFDSFDSFDEQFVVNTSVDESEERLGIAGEAADSSVPDLEDQLIEPAELADDSVQIIEGELIEPDPTEENGEAEPATATEAVPDAPVAAATNTEAALSVKMRGWRWPGYYLNKGYFSALGEVQFFATTPFAHTVLIRTENTTYAVSPRDPQRFVTELKLRRTLGATEEYAEGRKPGAFLSHPLWHDWAGRILIIVGLLCNLALFLYLLGRFGDLPDNLQIHFNKFGDPDRIGVRGDLMWLPFVGLVAVVANSCLGAWVQTRDKVPAYLLYAATIVVQFLVALALAGILAGANAGG